MTEEGRDKPDATRAEKTLGREGGQAEAGRQRLATAALLFACLVAGLALRLARASGGSLWFDELYAVRASRLNLGALLEAVPYAGHPPLYFLLGHVLLPHSESELAARSISLAAGIVAIALAYFLGSELFSRRAGVWAALLTAVSPALVMLSAEATNYSLFVAASLAALLFLARAVRCGRRSDWTGFTLAATAMLFTHGLGLVVLLAAVPFYLILDRRPRRRLRAWASCQAILAAVAAGWYLMMRSGPGPAFAPEPATVISGIARAPRTIIAGPAGVPVIGASWKVFLLIFLAASALMLSSPRVRKAAFSPASLAMAALLLIVTAVPVTLALSIVSYSAEQVSVRYYAAAIMPLLLLLALLIAAAPRRWGMLAGFLTVAGMLFLTISTLSVGNIDYRSVMKTVADEYQADDVLLCFPVHHCVVASDFYLQSRLPVKGGWVSDSGEVLLNAEPGKVWGDYVSSADDEEVSLEGAALAGRLRTELAGAGRVWLVTGDNSLGGLADSDALLAALEGDWRLVHEWDFEAPFRLRLFVPVKSA